MATQTWPATLPAPAQYSFAPRERRRVVASGDDPPAFRRFAREAIVEAQVRWTFTAQHMATFDTFFQTTLAIGVRWFNIALAGRGGVASKTARFIGPPRVVHLAAGVFDVAATLEVHPGELEASVNGSEEPPFDCSCSNVYMFYDFDGPYALLPKDFAEPPFYSPDVQYPSAKQCGVSTVVDQDAWIDGNGWLDWDESAEFFNFLQDEIGTLCGVFSCRTKIAKNGTTGFHQLSIDVYFNDEYTAANLSRALIDLATGDEIAFGTTVAVVLEQYGGADNRATFEWPYASQSEVTCEWCFVFSTTSQKLYLDGVEVASFNVALDIQPRVEWFGFYAPFIDNVAVNDAMVDWVLVCPPSGSPVAPAAAGGYDFEGNAYPGITWCSESSPPVVGLITTGGANSTDQCLRVFGFGANKRFKGRLDDIATLADGSIELYVNPGATSITAGVVARTNHWNTATAGGFAYRVRLFLEIDTWALILEVGDEIDDDVFTELAWEYPAYTSGWAKLKYEFNGSAHKVWLDDVLVIDITDSTYLTTGRVGLYGDGLANQFDEIVVTEL